MKNGGRSAWNATAAARAPRVRLGAAVALALAAGTLCTPTALAGPEGEVIVVGNVTIQRIGNEWIITASDGAVIHYDSFDILAGEIVRFVQPSEFARVLNRITGGEPTFIDGTLIANGRVYIVNPAGVVFGNNSVVNVGSIYAAAANLSDADFAAGVNNFTGASGTVSNSGSINAKEIVALVGAQVMNFGSISAPQGTVVMAAGERVFIGEQLGSLYVVVEGAGGGGGDVPTAGPGMASGDVYALAAWNDGTIRARQAHVESSGTTLVTGTIDVSGAQGGSAAILGERVELRGATVRANGLDGGGSIVVGGERASGGRASETIIDGDSSLRADAMLDGNGGSIRVEAADRLEVGGVLSARGGVNSGDGGLIETLSGDVLAIDASLDASAPFGDGGTWRFAASSLTLASSREIADGTVVGDNVMDDALIERAMNLGMDVEGDIAGDILQTVDGWLLKADSVQTELTLRSGGDIRMLGGIIAVGFDGRLDVNLEAAGTLSIENGIDLSSGWLSLVGDRVQITRSNAGGDPVFMRAGVVDVLARDGGVADLRPLYMLLLGDGTGRGLRVEGGEVTLDAWVDSRFGAGAQFFNSGVLTLAPDALFTLDGAFSQQGGPVRLGSDIYTTGDDITFGGAVTLIDSVLLNAFDGIGSTPMIWFAQTVDDDGVGRDLTADAGMGSIAIDGALGGSSPLRSLWLRAAQIRMSDATTVWGQRYVADEVTFAGTTYTTLGFGGGDGPRGDDRVADASIRVLDDAALGFDGRAVLANDAAFTTAGGFGDDVEFASTVVSQAGGYHTLRIDAGEGLALFGGTVGGGAGSEARLGFVEVADAAEAKLFGSVYTRDGFSWWVPVELHAADTVLHVGDGVGLFAQHVYAASFDDKGGTGGVNVSFLYDGSAFVRLGEARVPFKFRRSIGADAFGSGGRAFGQVTLGGDLDGAAALATFLFASNADEGLSLLDLASLDLGQSFGIFATQGVEMGRGQKLTSFGSLSMVAEGFGPTRIGVGDLNVLGDLTLRAVGGEIVFKGRTPGGIEDQSTELARLTGQEFSLSPDQGAEVIVLGDMVFDADSISFDGPTQTRFGSLTAGTLLGGLIEVEAVPALGLGLFENAAGGLAYPYDLRLVSDPINPNLATALVGDGPFDPRYEGRYYAEREVLAELGLNPREASAAERRRAAIEGRDVIADQAPPTTGPTASGIVLTLDRVSRDAVSALADAYITLLGPRLSADAPSRARADEVRATLANAWTRFGSDAGGFRAWVATNDPGAAGVLAGMDAVAARLADLGLPAFEQGVAEERLASVLRPEAIPADAFDRLLFDTPEAVATR